MDLMWSAAVVSMPPVPQAGSRMLMTCPAPVIVSSSGAISRLTISSMTSRGVKCSPAVSLESSANFRIRCSKT